MATSELISALIGGSLGGVAVQWLGVRTEIRERRAAAITALAEIEHLRWVDPAAPQPDDAFIKACRRLEGHAMITGISRAVTEDYLTWAWVAHRISTKEAALHHGEVDAGAIPTELATFVDKHARLLADVLWRPTISKITAARRRKNLSAGKPPAHPWEEDYGALSQRAPWRRHEKSA